jgi:glycosyltransferase involved in cell wall biosynthesis
MYIIFNGSVILAWLFLNLILFKFFRNLILVTHNSNSDSCVTQSDEVHVDILIAARNEEENLDILFDALELQDWSRKNFRIIFVDDSSTDRTATIAQERLNTFSGSNFISGIGKGKISALALGEKQIDNKFILFCDADCQPQPGWIRTHIAALLSGNDVVCGHVRLLNVSPLRNFESALSSIRVAAGCGMNAPSFTRGANWSIRKAMLDKIGGFKSIDHFSSGDDVHLLNKLKTQSARFSYQGSSTAHVLSRENLSAENKEQQSRRRYGKLRDIRITQTATQALTGIIAAYFLVAPICLNAFDLYSPGWINTWIGASIITLIASLACLRKGFVVIDEKEIFNKSYLLFLLIPFTVYYMLVGNVMGYNWKSGKITD